MTVTVVSDGLASLEKVMLCSPSGAQKGPKVFHVPQKDLHEQPTQERTCVLMDRRGVAAGRELD